MKVGILFHETRADHSIAERLASLVKTAGHEVIVFSTEDPIVRTDRLIILGGDGTVLRAAREVSAYGTQMVGVNFGNLGFLTEFEREEAEEAVRLVLDERCPVIHRSMLEVSFNGKTTYCLNELALLRPVMHDAENRAVKISVTIDLSPAGDFVADGLIIATPTGSTAYSLSAGGSIMTPDCETFLLTPVCAFSMRSRPVACSDKSILNLSVEEGAEPLMMFGDGIFLGSTQYGDVLNVKKSTRYASFLTRDKGGFFRRLTEKIS